MSTTATASGQIDQLLALSRSLADEGQTQEAAELLQLALRLKPDCAEARSELEKVRNIQRSTLAARPLLDAAQWEEFRRRALDAGQFFGLAKLYANRGEDDLALDCLDAARLKGPPAAAQLKLRGEILLRRGEPEQAARELARALRLDPFDAEAAEALGLAEQAVRRFAKAAEATAHALLLAGRLDSPAAERLRRRLSTLKRILGCPTSTIANFIRRAEELLLTAQERLEWHRQRFLDGEQLIPGGAVFGAPVPPPSGRLTLASRLRRSSGLTPLSDEHLFRLASLAQEELHAAGSVIFPHRSSGFDLYLVESGAVRLERASSYGTYALRSLRPGNLLGEVGWVLRKPRGADAVALKPTRLLRLDGAELERAAREAPDLATELLWALWRSLAEKLRQGNERLRTIFAEQSLPQEALVARLRPVAHGETVVLAREEKVRIFREHDLSARELKTLAAFSRTQRFPAGTFLFREGDPGTELYAVAEGKVVISKFIAGAGDEALAVLGRGEFFGEMSLIDGQPRSADAKAEGGPVTVLAIDRDTLQELLTLDPTTAGDVLRLLCRLLARRLTEIDEKVFGWQILAAGQSAAPAAG